MITLAFLIRGAFNQPLSSYDLGRLQIGVNVYVNQIYTKFISQKLPAKIYSDFECEPWIPNLDVTTGKRHAFISKHLSKDMFVVVFLLIAIKNVVFKQKRQSRRNSATMIPIVIYNVTITLPFKIKCRMFTATLRNRWHFARFANAMGIPESNIKPSIQRHYWCVIVFNRLCNAKHSDLCVWIVCSAWSRWPGYWVYIDA